MQELKKTEENYKSLIRKYATCDLIEFLSKKSIESYKFDKKGVTFVDVPYYKKSGEKGVAKEIIDDLIEEIEDEDEISKASILAEKFAKNREKSLKNKQKCLAHLVRKGYDYSVAQQATNKVFNSCEGENYDWI